MATPGFRNGVLAIFVIAGVLAIGGGFLAGRLLQAAVERSSPTPSVPTDPGEASTEPSTPAESPAESPSTVAAVPDGRVITPKGAQLRESTGDMYEMSPETGCESLLQPGYAGECGVEDMAGGQTAWVVEGKPVQGLATAAHSLRVLTFSNELGGWVEQLRARDPQARKWASIRVVPRDLTGDGKPELVVGYHFLGSGGDLGIDIVENDDGVPVVAAHPDDAIQGSVVFRGRSFDQYMAQYPNREPNCCPPYFLRRTIRYVDGSWIVVATERVDPVEIPPSQV
jgi:hypothetical protein